ncbi:MAG: ECF transporter S component [Lachnospiraceae bacterium]|nr:ECF transporter S component [Lachnospiraceae bacterium]
MNKFMITAVCIALCIVLPVALHSIPNAGTLFSPMHIPVLLCGIICGWPYGLLCGLIGPLLSSLLTSMPVMAKLPFMMVELAVYGMLTGLVMHLLRTGKLALDLYASLLIAMLSGRIVAGILRAFFLAGESYSWSIWVTSYFVSCLPGILVQLILIPILYIALERAGLIPTRYPQ